MEVQVNYTITDAEINKALQILIDNGIDEAEADTVLQAIGYALVNVELFPNM